MTWRVFWTFRKKLKNLGHFPTVYENSADLLLKFGQQLDKLADNGFIKLHADDEAISKSEGKFPHYLTAPPFLSETFLGREDELKAIHNKLFSDNNLLLLVNGDGGVGKTSIAAKYFDTYQSEYAHLAWILSEKSIANALFSTLAAPLDMRFEDAMPADERLERLLTKMAELDKPCLLVIDNANEVEDLKNNLSSV